MDTYTVKGPRSWHNAYIGACDDDENAGHGRARNAVNAALSPMPPSERTKQTDASALPLIDR